jgi:hypothetical protein
MDGSGVFVVLTSDRADELAGLVGDSPVWIVHSERNEEAVERLRANRALVGSSGSAFHEECAPKRPSKADVEGYERFREEWFRRRGKPFAAPVRRGWFRR